MQEYQLRREGVKLGTRKSQYKDVLLSWLSPRSLKHAFEETKRVNIDLPISILHWSRVVLCSMNIKSTAITQCLYMLMSTEPVLMVLHPSGSGRALSYHTQAKPFKEDMELSC